MSPFRHGNSGVLGTTRGHLYWGIWLLVPTVNCLLPPPIVSRLSADAWVIRLARSPAAQSESPHRSAVI
jgi:hypothetical protein